MPADSTDRTLPETLARCHHASAAGREVSPAAAAFLRAAAALCSLARSAKRALYDWRVLPTVRLNAFTISVGNITTGGTGKTPLTAKIASWLASRGVRVVVLSRGYGRRAGRWAEWASLDGRLASGPEEVGDEAHLLARTVSGVDVLVGKRRAVTGEAACRIARPGALVLDDGFQYWRLRRDVDVLTLDLPLVESRLRPFPVGVLREPVSRLAGAHFIVLTGADRATDGQKREAMRFLDRHAPTVLRCFASHVIRRLDELGTARGSPPLALAGRTVLALAGLGRPEGFFGTLERLGVQVVPAPFPDHHRYAGQDLELVERRARAAGAECVVTTAKDEANLPPGYRPSMPFFVARAELVLEPDGERALDRLLYERLAARAARKAP